MSGIECINLLAFIQFIIAFDFGLYYLDNKHVLTEIYRKYQKDLKLSVREVLSRANDIRTESLKSEDNECILNSAYLDKAYRRLKYRKRLLNYILCIRFFIEVHSIVSASRFFHMPTYLRVVIECQSRFFPFFPAFSRNCPDYFLHTSGSSSFRSLSDLGAR